MRVRTALKKDEILACAAEVFRELGFERASMSEIAARVGGSKATLYGYFDSKEELFLAVTIEEATAHFAPVIDELRANVDVRSALQSLGEKLLPFVLGPHAIAASRMVLAVAGHQSDIGRSFFENGPKMGLTVISSYLATSIENGALKRGDTWVMAQQLVALLEAQFMRERLFGVLATPPVDSVVKEAVTAAIDVFLAAYAERGAGAQAPPA